MMRGMIIFQVFAILLGISEYVTAIGHCVYNGSPIAKGGAMTAERGSCYMVTCDFGGEIRRIECVAQDPEPTCRTSGYDLTKIYPHCCPFNVCPDDINYDEFELKI